MVLKKAPTAKFEEPTDDAAATATAEQQSWDGEGEKPEVQYSTPGIQSPAVGKTALAKVSKYTEDQQRVLYHLKDALHVNWDTLDSMVANQGNFMHKGISKVLGGEVILKLLSWQEQYVCAPKNVPKERVQKEHIKYSDDGKVSNDGTELASHMAYLKECFPKEGGVINKRVVLVGAIEAAEKNGDEVIGKLVQISFSPMSRGQFDRYLIQSMYDIMNERETPDSVKSITMECQIKPRQGGGGESFTQVNFRTYKD